MDTFKQITQWIEYFYLKGTQGDINFHAMGEPLLNPNLAEIFKYTHTRCPNLTLRLCTNGKLLTPELLKTLKEAGLSFLDISDHDAEITVRVNKMCQDLGLEGAVVRECVNHPHDWAGQVKWVKAQHRSICYSLDCGHATVLWNGDITPCCIDAFGAGVCGHIKQDNVNRIEIKPFDLCKRCHHVWNVLKV